jgi:hypothetical protein
MCYIYYGTFRILKLYSFNKKIRLGSNGDGGYVIGDLDGRYDFYISAGVGDEESFTRDFINKYNMNKTNSAAFDGTIKKYPTNFTDKIFFYRRNISTYSDINNANLSYFTDKYNDIFLKMDIEGAEFPWLLSLTDERLNKFKQIAMEVHDINDGSQKTLDFFKKLSNTHYLIHAHGNNCCKVTNKVPDVIELTYVRKNCFSEEPKLNNTILPIKNFDYPHNDKIPDIPLNFYPFMFDI